MIVWKLTLSQFLSKELKETGETAIPVEQFLAAALHPPYWYEGAEVELESHPGFATAPAKRPGMPLSLEYQVLLQKSEYGWTPVGAYVDDTVMVAEAVQRKGLGAELVLRCAPHRKVPKRRAVSPSGLATLKSAYRLAVQRAIADGKDVPAGVRSEYIP